MAGALPQLLLACSQFGIQLGHQQRAHPAAAQGHLQHTNSRLPAPLLLAGALLRLLLACSQTADISAPTLDGGHTLLLLKGTYDPPTLGFLRPFSWQVRFCGPCWCAISQADYLQLWRHKSGRTCYVLTCHTDLLVQVYLTETSPRLSAVADCTR